VYGGFRVPSNYDALLAKVIVHAGSRAEAIVKMQCALDEFIVEGIRTNIPLHQALLREPAVIEGRMSTRTIERVVERGF
jgi:acetyl-CoA carboxylase biotin carboxylase subunit